MSDKPDMKALGEQVRALAQSPRMQEIKKHIDALQQSPPEHIHKLGDELRKFEERKRMQLGPRGQFSVEMSKPNIPIKRSRGRPPGQQYAEDAALITAMRRKILSTGITKILPVARLFANAAKGSLDVESKARRLERAYRKRFGSAMEKK